MKRIQPGALDAPRKLNFIRYRLLAGTALSAVWATCAFADDTTVIRQLPEQVIIQAQQPDDFKVDVPSLSKLPEPLVDTPQTVNVLPESLLQDQAITNLNDALRTVPGVTLGAGEFSWQGNNPSIRGFVARNDMFLDGLRDFGSYYRDPYNLDSIEVLQGPSSVLFGRGSTGGVINQVSKVPQQDGFVTGALVGGTDLTRRATVDLDSPVPALGDDAGFRLNAMVHDQDVADRDVAKDSRFGLAPGLALGLGTSTRIVFSYFDQTADDVPDYGIPWFGTAPAPVPRQNFYGYTSDFLKTGTDMATLRIGHDVSPRHHPAQHHPLRLLHAGLQDFRADHFCPRGHTAILHRGQPEYLERKQHRDDGLGPGRSGCKICDRSADTHTRGRYRGVGEKAPPRNSTTVRVYQPCRCLIQTRSGHSLRQRHIRA